MKKMKFEKVLALLLAVLLVAGSVPVYRVLCDDEIPEDLGEPVFEEMQPVMDVIPEEVYVPEEPAVEEFIAEEPVMEEIPAEEYVQEVIPATEPFTEEPQWEEPYNPAYMLDESIPEEFISEETDLAEESLQGEIPAEAEDTVLYVWSGLNDNQLAEWILSGINDAYILDIKLANGEEIYALYDRLFAVADVEMSNRLYEYVYGLTENVSMEESEEEFDYFYDYPWQKAEDDVEFVVWVLCGDNDEYLKQLLTVYDEEYDLFYDRIYSLAADDAETVLSHLSGLMQEDDNSVIEEYVVGNNDYLLNPMYQHTSAEYAAMERTSKAGLRKAMPKYGGGWEELSISSVSMDKEIELFNIEDSVSLEEVIAIVRNAMEARASSVVLPIFSSGDSLVDVNSLVFAACRHNGNPAQGDYLMWTWYSFQFTDFIAEKINGVWYTEAAIGLDYYTTAEQEAVVGNWIRNAITSLDLNNVYKTDYDRVKEVYDYVCKTITYDNEHLTDPSYRLQFTAYAGVANGTTVCQGYATLLYRFLLTLGIDCRVVTNVGHAWNCVRVGNGMYGVDATNDDTYNGTSIANFLRGGNSFNHENVWSIYDGQYAGYTLTAADYPCLDRSSSLLSNCLTCHEFTTANDSMQICSKCGVTRAVGAHDHVMDNGTTVKEASCSEKGLIEYRCVDCGTLVKTETIKTKPHSCKKVVTKQATCMEEGVISYVCKTCGKTMDEVTVAKTDHHCDEGTITEGTCGGTGVLTYKCIDCKTVLGTEIVPIDHVPDAGTVTKKATCTEDGVITYKCANCKEVVRTESITKLGHVSDNGTVTKKATCTEDGVITYKCANCKEVVRTESSPKLNHVSDAGTVTKAPTCAEEGVRTFKCERCGDVLRTESITKLGHVSDNGTVTKKATCTEDGVITYKCVNCKEVVRTESITKLGHVSDNGTVTKKATCTEDGVITYKCVNCKEVVRTESIPKLNHVSDAGTVTKAPTCAEEGVRTFKCERCGDVLRTESINKYDHVSDSGTVIKKASCTETGEITYKCVNCHETIRTETIGKKEHIEDSGTVTKEASCTARGEMTYHCTECGKLLRTESIAKKSHVEGEGTMTKEPSCTAKGEMTYYCTGCGKVLRTEAIAKKDHMEDEGTVTKEPSCVKEGERTYLCTECKTVLRTESIDKVDHVEDKGTVTKETSCKEAGEMTYRCTECHEILRTEEIEILPHELETETVEPTAYSGGYDLHKCKNCDYECKDNETEPLTDIYRVTLETYSAGDAVYADGIEIWPDAEGKFTLPEGCKCVTTARYSSGDSSSNYPMQNSLRVYAVRQNENGTYRADYIPGLDNLMQYRGTAIRVTGKQGLRVITEIPRGTREALVHGSGVDGWYAVEYGTLIAPEAQTSGNSVNLNSGSISANYAFRRGSFDDVYEDTGSTFKYTNAITFGSVSLCKVRLVVKTYMILSNGSETITVYSGAIHRSIASVAYQLKDSYTVGSAVYTCIHDILKGCGME